MSESGYIAHPTIDGTQLSGIAPVDFEVSPVQGILVQRLATGRHRKTVHFRGAGYPDVEEVYSWRVDYTKLADYLDFVSWIISRPGLHTFCNWKHVQTSWTVAASQVEFLLPWRVAVADTTETLIPFPSEDPSASRLQPVVTTDPLDENQDFAVIAKTTVEYDAETPSVGEAFLDSQGTRFKVGDILQQGAVVYASIVPLFNVFISTEISRKLLRAKEGRILVIQAI